VLRQRDWRAVEQVNVITWIWGSKYHQRDVARLARRVRKNLTLDHTFHVFTSGSTDGYASMGVVAHRIADPELCARNCFCRLRMFDPDWQRDNKLSGWIVSLDLDLVIVRSLDEVLAPSDQDFKILTGVNSTNPNPLNGSMMALRAGTHEGVWRYFSPYAANQIKYHEFPDDQGWIWSQMPNASGWQGGKEGVYAFHKPGWPGFPQESTYVMPTDARVIAFVGRRKPGMYLQLPWVKKYWLEQ